MTTKKKTSKKKPLKIANGNGAKLRKKTKKA